MANINTTCFYQNQAKLGAFYKSFFTLDEKKWDQKEINALIK